MITNEQPSKYRVQSLDRALLLIDEVAKTANLTLGELARRQRLSASQTLKILSTLEYRGLIIKEPNKTYRLGYSALQLGHHAGLQMPIISAAAATLDWLQDETNESIHLVFRNGLDTVIADVRESGQTVRTVAPIGQRGKLHVGASGRLFLAFSPSDLTERALSTPLRSYTPDTLTDPDAVRREVAQTRKDGVAVARGDFEEGAYSVAAPIFGADEQIVASVAITGPLSRLDKKTEASLRKLVKQAGERITKKLEQRSATT